MIYIAHPECGGPIKIGHSVRPEDRAAAFSLLLHTKITILKTFDGSARSEMFLHLCFNPISVANEWFKPCAPIWRFIDDLEDSGRPAWLRRVERNLSTPTKTKFLAQFENVKDAKIALGYSPKTALSDIFSTASERTYSIHARLNFWRAMNEGILPSYISDLHPKVSKLTRIPISKLRPDIFGDGETSE